MATEIPYRYFLASNNGDNGGLISIKDGVKVVDKDTQKVSYVNPKKVCLDKNAILKTNDKEVIYTIYKNKLIKSQFINITTGKVNELFVNKDKDSQYFSEFYNINIDENIIKIKKAIEDGLYAFTPKIKLTAELAIAKEESDNIELDEIKIANEMRKLKVEEDKSKIAESKRKNSKI